MGLPPRSERNGFSKMESRDGAAWYANPCPSVSNDRMDSSTTSISSDRIARKEAWSALPLTTRNYYYLCRGTVPLSGKREDFASRQKRDPDGPTLADNVEGGGEGEELSRRGAESLMAAPWGLKNRHTVSQQAAAIKIVLEDRTFNPNSDNCDDFEDHHFSTRKFSPIIEEN